MAQEITFTLHADGTWQGSFTSTGTKTILQVLREKNSPLYIYISADNGDHNVVYQPPKPAKDQILSIDIAEGALVTIVSHSEVTEAYYIASELDYYTKDEIDDKMEQIHQFEPVVASSLPTASADTMYKFYFIPKQSAGEQTNTKEEWMTVKEGSNYRWEKVGDTEVDLSDYVTVDDLEEYIENSKSFKGWFDSPSALSAAYPSPKVGDYAYIKGASASDPAAIYECATAGTWSDSGRDVDTSSVQTFASGEEVNEVGIDDEPTAGSENLVKSGGVVNSIKKTYYIDEIDLSEIASNAYSITSSGNWGFSSKARHKQIKVSPGESFFIKGSDNYESEYAFFTNNTVVSGSSAPFVDGTNINKIPVSSSVQITIPDGCNYLYILDAKSSQSVSVYGYLPTKLEKLIAFGNTYDKLLTKEAQNLTDTEKEQVRENLGVASKNFEQFALQKDSLYITKPYGILNTGKFGTSTVYAHGVVKVQAGEIVYMRSYSTTANIRYAFVTTDDSSSGADIPVVEGTNIVEMLSGEEKFIEIPEGTEYFIWNCAPWYLSIFNKIDNIIEQSALMSDTQKSVFRNNINVAIKDNSTIVLEGNGTKFIPHVSLPKLDVGVTYRALILYPKSDIATTNFGLAFYSYIDGSSTRIAEWPSVSVPSYFDITPEEGVDYYAVGGRASVGDVIIIKIVRRDAIGASEEDITEIVSAAFVNDAKTVKDRTVFELNPDTEMLQKMVLTKKKYDDGASGASTIPTLSLAHISDVHGGGTQMARFIEFANHWKQKGYIDELIDTGDVVSNTYSNGTTWRDSIEGIEEVITVVGNHDTRADADEIAAEGYPSGQNPWQYHSAISLDTSKRKDAYNLLMIGPNSTTPYIDNWSVVQPSGAADSGLCYFCKDYASQKIRLIGVDAMGYDNVQNTWLQSVLAETLDSNNAAHGYHIIILTHFTGGQMVGLDCNYTSLRATGADYGSNYNENLYLMPEAINSFQSNGGIFIGYIIGHYHRDMVNVLEQYPKQLAFAVSSGGKVTVRDFTKVVGCKSYDDFQIVSINTYDKTVRLVKVGADTDYYMRKKGTLCVGYNLVKDDGTSPEQGETPTKVRGIIGEGF